MKSANRACRPFSIDAIGPAIQITKLNQTALQTLGLVSLAALCKPDIRSCLRCLRLRRTFFTLCIILKAKFFAVLRIFLLLLNRQYICPFLRFFLIIFLYTTNQGMRTYHPPHYSTGTSGAFPSQR